MTNWRGNNSNSNSRTSSGFSFGRDVFGFQTPTQVGAEQAGQNTWGIDSVEELEDGRGLKVGWHLDLKTLHGGLNKTRGEWPRHGHRVSQSWLDTRWPDMVIPNLAHVSGGGATPSENRHGLHWTNVETAPYLLRLIEHYSLGEASGTRAGNFASQTLTDNNTVTQAVGKVGNAAQFTAANLEFLSRSDPPLFELGALDEWYMAVWVYLDSKGADRVIMSKWNTTGDQREWELFYRNTNDRYSIFTTPDGTTGSGTPSRAANTFGSPNTAEWHFIEVWKNLTQWAIAVNQTGDDIATSPTIFSGGTADFRIGADHGGNYWDGRIDEPFFKNYVPDADERAFYYNGGDGRSWADIQAYTRPVLILGSGGGANASLLAEDDDAVLQSITYSPGTTTPVTSVQSLITGGITNAARLVVGRYNAAPQVFTDIGGTVAGSMHTGWNSLWAMFQTTLPDIPLLGYAGTSLKTMLATDAIGTAPTTVLSNIPGGGYGVGIIARGGGRLRAYFVRPKSNLANGMLLYGSEQPGIVFHVNQEGTDPQDMTPSDWLGMTEIKHCIPYEDGLLATDGRRIVFNADYVKRDYGIFYDRDTEHVDYRVLALGTNGAAIQALVAMGPRSGSIGAKEYAWIEEWSPLAPAWHAVSERLDWDVGIAPTVITPVGGLPRSLTSEYRHWFNATDEAWYRQPVAPYGSNPLFYYNNRGKAFKEGITYLPKFKLPDGLDGWPSAVARIIPTADLYDLGAGAIVNWVFGGKTQTLTFASGKIEDGAYWKTHQPFEQNDSFFFDLEGYIDLQNIGDDGTIPVSLLPVRVEGYTFVGARPEALEAEKLRLPEGGASR